jgi:hypothetical protein
MTEAYLIVTVVVAWLAVVGVNVARCRKYVFATIAFFGLALVGGPTLLGLIGAIRLGKPRSWWAQRFYDGEKMAEAKRRFYQPLVVQAQERRA